MRVTHPPVRFTDARGAITDIVQREAFDAATIITTRKGAVRGNHWHAQTVQFMYLVSGRMRIASQIPGRAVERVEVRTGDLVLDEPLERHAMRALEDTTFVVLTRGPRGGTDYESDTHRLGPDELLEREE